jgi:hypothetical protein
VSLKKRVFIEAIRTIPPGHELSYDYQIQRDPEDAPDVDVIFACRCGAPSCRGSMLEPRKKPRAARRHRAGGTRRKPRKRTVLPVPKKSARRGR